MMIRRLASFMLAASLLCALCVTSASANTPAEVKSEGMSNQPAPRADVDREAKPGEKLKADVSKMVADAKAGKSGTTLPPRQQPRQSNNLSKEQKIVIGVGITVAVLAIIYFSVFAGKHL